MFFHELIVILIICNLFDRYLQYNNNFCDSNYEKNMIDIIFNTETTVYAVRKVKSLVYPLIYLKDNQIWAQKMEAIKLKDFFLGIDLQTFESGFSITSIDKKYCSVCEPVLKEKSNNITYIFSDDRFYVFRELTNGSFMFADSRDSGIPWKKNKSSYGTNTGVIKDLFGISGKVNAAFFQWQPLDPLKAYAFLLSTNGDIFGYEINDNSTLDKKLLPPVSNVKEAGLDPIHFRGAFCINYIRTYYVVRNHILYYIPDKRPEQGIKAPQLDIWDFFNCYKTEDPLDLQTSNTTSENLILDNIVSVSYQLDLQATENADSGRKSTVSLFVVFTIICIGITALLFVALVAYILMAGAKRDPGYTSEERKRLDHEESPDEEFRTQK